MVPRDDIAFLSLENSLEQNLAVIHNTEYTRYPLCESALDTVVGMIHIKDLFNRSSALQTSEGLRLLQHEMLFVPETQAVDSLQATFQSRRAHMAVVVDEYGVPTGLVTMENVLEELVGEIRDEFDEDEKPKIVPSPKGVFVDGMLLVDELCRELEIELKDSEDDTVGGYVTTELGKIARVGDRFTLGDYEGRVVEMSGRRISRVLLAQPATKAVGAAE
jgi:CBS domain containing-hemolysin-like protein